MDDPLEELCVKIEVEEESFFESEVNNSSSSLNFDDHVEENEGCDDLLKEMIPCCVVLDPNEVGRHYCADTDQYMIHEEISPSTSSSTFQGIHIKSEPMDTNTSPYKSEPSVIKSETPKLEVKQSEFKDTEWSDDTSYFDNLNIDWESEKEQLKLNINSESTELEYFTLICDTKLLETIVKNTNLQGRNNKKIWSKIDVNDLKAVLGILILMSLYHKDNVCDYWKDTDINCKKISDTMEYTKFKLITDALQMNNNKPSDDELHDVRPLLDTVNANVVKLYKHSQKLSVDDMFIKCRGDKVPLQMFINSNAHGIKAWLLNDTNTGYTLHIKVCVDSKMYSSENTMLEICNIIETKPCILAFDNATVNLMLKLLDLNIFAIGKVDTNIKEGLPEFMCKTEVLQMIYSTMYQTKGKLAAIKWIDFHEILMLTTCVSPKALCIIQNTFYSNTSMTVLCPVVYSKYKELTNGENHFCNMDLGTLAVFKYRRYANWWLKLFQCILDISIVNASILYEIVNNIKGNRNENERRFRENLAYQLIGSYNHTEQRIKPISIEIGEHLEVPIEGNSKKCKYCFVKFGVHHRSRFSCGKCSVALCFSEKRQCFKLYHAYKNIKYE